MLSKWTLFQIYWKARPYIKRLEELSKMKLTTTNLVQMLLALIGIANILEPFATGKTKLVVGAILGCAHVVVNTLAGKSNPDGTPAATAYEKPNTTILPPK